MEALSRLSLTQALSVWSELEQAYYGDNGFGSDTAEIYAYRVREDCPTVYAMRGSEYAREHHIEAAENLYAILKLFAEKRDCIIHVDGRRLGRWLCKVEFDHRVRVRISRKKSRK